MINCTVIVLSLLAQFRDVYEVLAFQPRSVLGQPAVVDSGPMTDEGDELVPMLWTLITCVMFETNFFFLIINLLLINYVINLMENFWSRTSFCILTVFTATLSGLMHLFTCFVYA